MRFRIVILILSAGAMLGLVDVARAEPLDSAAVHAEPQYYLLALPKAPVNEIAAQVLGEALGLPFQIDEDVDAEMSFRAEGLFAPKALAKEFADRLRDVDVVLVERPSDGLWLIPAGELDDSISQGAVLVTAEDTEPSLETRAIPPAAAEETAEAAPSPAPIWPGWLALAAVMAAAGWSGLLAASGTRKRPLYPLAALPDAPQPPSDDLIVPYFEQIETPAQHPNGGVRRI